MFLSLGDGAFSMTLCFSTVLVVFWFFFLFLRFIFGSLMQTRHIWEEGIIAEKMPS